MFMAAENYTLLTINDYLDIRTLDRATIEKHLREGLRFELV